MECAASTRVLNEVCLPPEGVLCWVPVTGIDTFVGQEGVPDVRPCVGELCVLAEDRGKFAHTEPLHCLQCGSHGERTGGKGVLAGRVGIVGLSLNETDVEDS